MEVRIENCAGYKNIWKGAMKQHIRDGSKGGHTLAITLKGEKKPESKGTPTEIVKEPSYGNIPPKNAEASADDRLKLWDER